MAHCRATYKIPVSSDKKAGSIELACDLDDGHMPLFSRHYDSFYKLEWLHKEDPEPVMGTRTGPPHRVASSVAAITSNFEQVK